MATYYVQLSGGQLRPKATLAGGIIYPSSGGGGGSMQVKSVSYTPSETAITDHVVPDLGYDGLSRVNVSVGAIDSNYVGSSVPRKSSSDLTASGATVTAPSGYYSANATKTIPNASAPYLSAIYIESDGTASADVEIGTGGYIANDTYEANLSQSFPVQGAQTITPGTTNQTIASGKYLTGAQTILGDADLVAENIKKDVTIFGVTGTYEGSGGGQKVLINESVITQDTASVVVDNISYDNLLITTTGLKTAKTSGMGMYVKVTGSISGVKNCLMYSGNVFSAISNHSGWCRIEDLGNGYKLGTRTDSPVLPENTITLRTLGAGNNSAVVPYQFGDITKIELVPSEGTYPFTAGTIRVYGW